MENYTLNPETDVYDASCIGATAVLCFAAIIYVYAYCAEILRAQKDGETVKEAAFMRIMSGIPFLMQLIDYIVDKIDGTATEEKEPELPLTTQEAVLPAPPTNPLKLHIHKILRFQNSVASSAASPHYEDDFFFGDIPPQVV